MLLQPSKKVLVTGANGVLGSAVIRKYLESGYEVTGLDLQPCAIPEKGNGNLKWLQVDLSQPQAIESAVKGQEFGVLVHCAGGFRFAKVEDLTDKDLDFLINTNLKSAFYLSRALIPGMKKQKFGRILFISARATLQPGAGMAAYAASKAGLNSLTAALAAEVKDFNINVNSVLPTVIDTPANRRDMPNADFTQWVTPQQLAEVIFSFSSPWGDVIQGAMLPVSGRL